MCFAAGIGGVRFGVKPVAVAPRRVPALESGALAWFPGLSQKIGAVLVNAAQVQACVGTAARGLGPASWLALFPGCSIALTVLAFNMLGDGLGDLLDPRLR